MPPDSSFDAIVVGAGPAGTAAAAVLAERGRSVALVERERFPRYRVGESLIPHCWYPLERLGMVAKLESAGAGFPKHSVQFVGLDGVVSKPFYFFEHTDHPSARTWQVARPRFDQLLLDNAVGKGARLFEETAVTELLRREGRFVGVRARDAAGRGIELHAPITIDATGRDALAQARNRWRVQDRKLRKVALWTYYDGALRDPGLDAGATTIAYLPGKGWFWYLPLVDDVVSVGIVAEADYLYRDTRDPEAIFLREVGVQPWIERHLAPGRPRGEFRTTQDFSYRSRHCAADGLVLCGDAFAFLDPVFSSGVFFALHSGILAGDAAHEALARGDVSAASFAAYGERFCREIEAMRGLVHAFYDTSFSFGDFFRAHPDCRADVTDVLIGNLGRSFEELFRAMSLHAAIPEPLPHGGPLVPRDGAARVGSDRPAEA